MGLIAQRVAGFTSVEQVRVYPCIRYLIEREDRYLSAPLVPAICTVVGFASVPIAHK